MNGNRCSTNPDYNPNDERGQVLKFGVENGIATKCITLVRHDESTDFYENKGTFIDPNYVTNSLRAVGCKLLRTDPTKVGGFTDYYAVGEGKEAVSVIVKVNHCCDASALTLLLEFELFLRLYEFELPEVS